MPNAFVRKLSLFGPLSIADREILESLCRQPIYVDADEDLVREGDVPTSVHVILDGYACRYKILADGARSIVAYLLPGDICDLNVFILKQMDHSIATLSRSQIVRIPPAKIIEITEKHPLITRALWWIGLVDDSVLREWIVNVTRRSAEQSIAHLFCELLFRLESVGLRVKDGFEFPLTQTELADTVGLTTVHVNRVLQELRARNLILLKSKSLQILNLNGLKELAGFRPNYLHLGGGNNAPP